MLRLVLVGLGVVFATHSQAQAPPPLEPGTRVRISFPPGDGPLGADAYVGVLQSIGDTLVVATEAGPVLQPRARDLAAVEVSQGRRPFSSWLIPLGVAVGAGTGYLLAESLPLRQDCHPRFPSICGEPYRTGEFYIVLGAGLAVGAAASTYAAVLISEEQWVPAGELTASPGGLSWRLAL